MQNYNDILNGVTDGTKDLTISALTVNGAANLKAAVTLGASSSNDLTVNGALASTIVVKTDNSFDIGATTKGLRAIYFGANSQRVKVAGSASMSASWTFTLPVTAGAANGLLLTDGSGNTSWSLVGQIPGTATSDSATTGNVGEYLQSVSDVSTNWTTGSGTIADATTLTLTAGDWDVQGQIVLVRNGATFSSTDSVVAIDGAAGASETSGLVTTRYNASGDRSSTFGNYTMQTPLVRVKSDGTNLVIDGVTTSTSQVIRLKLVVATFSAGTPQIRYFLRARRVR